ncbi:UNVERIFIED_CONTAM: hypothetical protein FKN15_074454 [Acipenser sinensis]
MGGKRLGGRRKSCQKQQQERGERRWWSWDPTQQGPPYWDTEQEQFRAEGSPLCVICREFGHGQEDCPYEDLCFWKAYSMGRVSCASGWFWLLEQQTPSPPQAKRERKVRRRRQRGNTDLEWEEPKHPAPEWEEPECPALEWEESVRPQPKRGESDPQLLILDEPTIDVDPVLCSRSQIPGNYAGSHVFSTLHYGCADNTTSSLRLQAVSPQLDSKTEFWSTLLEKAYAK